MKQIIPLALSIILIGCSSNQNDAVSNVDSNIELEKPKDFEENLNKIFGEVDSTNILNSVGCVQGYFAQVSSEYIIRIPASIYSENESNRDYRLGKDGIECELLVFKKDSSHLANICTDIIITNYPKPIREIKSIEGKMKVFIGNKEELWGNEVNNAYIKIEYAEFIDSLNNYRRIEIKDKYLWKILNLGTPG